MRWNGPPPPHPDATVAVTPTPQDRSRLVKQITTIGLDLAKQIFQVHGADSDGFPVFNRRLRRAEVLRFFEKQPACLVGLGACGSAHYWAREIAALGHDVRLIPPAYVKPFVKRGKTDAADAEAISEAVTRKTMRFVSVKSAAQQAAGMVLKTRALLVRQQTQVVNALRAHMSEFGIVAAIGTAKASALIAIVRDETDSRLPKAAHFALAEIANQIDALTTQIESSSGRLWPRRSAMRTCGDWSRYQASEQ